MIINNVAHLLSIDLCGEHMVLWLVTARTEIKPLVES